MKKRNDARFRELAPRAIDAILDEITEWSLLDAVAAMGNSGHESGGFMLMQEMKPTVAGSRGGWGWFQWTGPRRRAFEAWAKARGLNFASYEANLGFLLHELRTTEKATIARVARAQGLNAKTKEFELAYERAGVKHYSSRYEWAQIALNAYHAQEAGETTEPRFKPVPDPIGLTDKDTVLFVQTRLRDLGYAEVGGLDGRLGDLTAGAIRIFRADNKLPEGGYIDVDLIVTLTSAKARVLSPEREFAKPEEVREKVPEVKAAWLGKLVSRVTAQVSAAGAAVTLIIGQLGEATAYLTPVKRFVGDVPGWMWFALLAGAAYYLSRQLRQGEVAGIEAFQQGARR